MVMTNNNANGERDMKTMNVTIQGKDGICDIFTLSFLASNFMAVVDAIGNLTHKNIYENTLWEVV
jgi:hypothetical protein